MSNSGSLIEGRNVLQLNRERWLKLPGGKYRFHLRFLHQLPEWLFKWLYNRFTYFWQKERGWEYERYSALFAGRHILEFGGGMGYDGIQYARQAASYTWAELSLVQLDFLKKVASLYGQGRFHFEHLAEPMQHVYPQMYDALYAHGVLHHVPFDVAQKQFLNADKFLLPGAKVVLLMYPKERWIACGCPSFEKFGRYTDGGCPWAEWYDDEKIKQLCGENYTLQNTIYWGHNQTEFVNFELVKKR